MSRSKPVWPDKHAFLVASNDKKPNLKAEMKFVLF